MEKMLMHQSRNRTFSWIMLTAGGLVVVLLSFWATLIILDRLNENGEINIPLGQSITCRIPLRSAPQESEQLLPILVIGETGKADTVYMRREGNQILFGIDDWGSDRKEVKIEAVSVNNTTLNIILDYTLNTTTVLLGNRKILQNSGKLAIEMFGSNKIFLGQNPINYPSIASTFPEVVQLTKTGAATCEKHDIAKVNGTKFSK